MMNREVRCRLYVDAREPRRHGVGADEVGPPAVLSSFQK